MGSIISIFEDDEMYKGPDGINIIEDRENGIVTFKDSIFTLAMDNREPFLNFLNYFQKINLCKIKKINAKRIDKVTFKLNSIKYLPVLEGRSIHLFTGISSKKYRNIDQILICDFWYANY
jgi:hypothetical protein